MHVHGVKPAKSSFGMIPSRKGTGKKTSENSPQTALFSLPYIESTVKAQKGHFSSNNERVKRHEKKVNTHVPAGEVAKSSFGRLRNPS